MGIMLSQTNLCKIKSPGESYTFNVRLTKLRLMVGAAAVLATSLLVLLVEVQQREGLQDEVHYARGCANKK